jgi:hypothetical protein
MDRGGLLGHERQMDACLPEAPSGASNYVRHWLGVARGDPSAFFLVSRDIFRSVSNRAAIPDRNVDVARDFGGGMSLSPTNQIVPQSKRIARTSLV